MDVLEMYSGKGGKRRFTGDRGRKMEAPVKVGERYKVKIESMGKGGDGIARIKGFVIFVPHTKVGDEVEIVINSVKRRFAFAEVIE
ncbi:TRAM domain-containing protein [Pyrococcus horikoshii]|nr:TRAM domain-containing protein [Pyrococcus horikoshii]